MPCSDAFQFCFVVKSCATSNDSGHDMPFYDLTEKATKLKQAREEAEREITAYKADLEEKYQGRLSEVKVNMFRKSKTKLI